MKTHSAEITPQAGRKTVAAGRSELEEYLALRRQRRRIFPRAMLVGAVAGVAALSFRVLLAFAERFRTGLVLWAHDMPKIGWVFPALFAAAGAVAATALVRRYAPEAAGSGIPHLKAVVYRLRALEWKRLLPVKFFGGIVAIGSGLALGREGPTVQMGGAVGEAFSRWLKMSGRERIMLISAGAGAGLAAAFNAPLSGLVFVLEELRRDFQPVVFGATFVAAMVATVIARLGSGQLPVFNAPSYPVLPLGTLPVFALLGMAAGILGVAFNRGLLAAIRMYARVPARFAGAAAAVTGGMVGLVGWFFPTLMGTGHALVESALKGDLVLAVIPVFFVIRFLLTSASYATGAPGGIFAPLLVLGALLGLMIGRIACNIMPEAVPEPAVFAAVGMAAYFTAVVRAPLTGIMLIVEMTASYSQMLPLLVSCFGAYAVAEWLKDVPIYEALLARDLQRGGKAYLLNEPAVVEFLVQPGAPFAGREVRALGLPPGCILVRCSDGKSEYVPKANTVIEPHMRITAVIAPEAAAALDMLRQGCHETPAQPAE